MYNREAISGIAGKHGLIATFLPKLSATTAGSGAHLHLSIVKACGCFQATCPALTPASSIASASALMDLV